MTTDRPSSHDAETAAVTSRSTSSAEAISRLLASEKVPERIGEYKIIRLIGSGGMGLVYLAQRGDSTFSQTVALKVIKKGMDSEDILHRFEMERQLLSGLNHPNIARLIDGGTTDDGRPFFALEFVDGQPIDKYCDTNKLSTRDRLSLFRKVCSAVHYAHQNLIVHRDLKPGNVLINPQGDPKLLDFGIAKLLNPTLFQAVAVTGPSVRLMTPEYASPEQVKGEPITTASDIYSLGVMLYELLTGRRPYKFKTRLQQEIVRIVCEEPPEKPSTVISRADDEPVGEGKTRRVDPTTIAETREGGLDRLRRRLRGDIDDIVLKALEKTPTRRYQSAEQFSEDINRHLTGEPVIARPPSISYRAAKFVERNRGKVLAAAAVALALVAGTIGTSVQWARAEQARQEEHEQRNAAELARENEAQQRNAAEAARDTAEKSYRDTWDVLNSYIGDVHIAVAKLPNAVEAREVIVETASKKMRNLADQWKDDPERKVIVSGGFERLGQLASDIRGGSKGDTAKALAFQQTGLDMRRELLQAKPDNKTYQRLVATSHVRLGDVHRMMGDAQKEQEAYEQARALLEPLNDDTREGALARTQYAAVLGQLGDLKRDAGELAAAASMYEKSDAARRVLRDAAVADAKAAGLEENEARRRRAMAAQARRNVTVGQMDSARIHIERGENEKALALFAEAVNERRALLAEEPTQARTQRDLAVALLLSSEAHSDAGKHADAIREATESADLMSKLTAQEAQSSRPDARNITTLGNCRGGVAAANFAAAESSADRKGSLEAALRSWTAAAELFAERLAADPENAGLKQFLADARSSAGTCLLKLGRPSEALDAGVQAVGIVRELVSASPNDLRLKRSFALDLRRLADAHAALADDPQRAADDRRRSREAAVMALTEAVMQAEAVANSELGPANGSASIESLRQALTELQSGG